MHAFLLAKNFASFSGYVEATEPTTGISFATVENLANGIKARLHWQ